MMFRLTIGRVFLVVASLVLTCGWAPTNAMQKKPIGRAATSGSKWNYTVVDENNKLVVKGVFFAHDNKITNPLNKQVGTYEEVSLTHVKMDVADGNLKGKIDLRRDNPNVPSWQGELERGSGLKHKITIVFEKLK